MRFKKSYGAMAVMMLWVGLLVAACGGGGGSGTGSTGAGGGGGATLTFTGLPMSSISGLSYSSLLSSSVSSVGMTAWVKTWANLVPNGGEAAMTYASTSVQDYLIFTSTANFTVATPVWYNAGTPPSNSCWIGGASNPQALPTCASWGIAVSRAGGTIAFNATPVFNTANSAVTGTMSGALSFPTF